MSQFDDLQGLFETLGMSEQESRVAATGRGYRSEAEARAGELEADAEWLAEDLIARASGSSGMTSPYSDLSASVQRLEAALPTIAENAVRKANGQPLLPVPELVPQADFSDLSPPVAEVASAIQRRLRTSVDEARQLATRFHAREVSNGGVAHADHFVGMLTQALRREVREVASW